MAGQQLVDHDTDGVDVGGRRELAVAGLLGRHVRRRAEDLPGPCGHGGAAADHAGHAEVGDLHCVGGREHEVLGLDVAMEDAVLVGAVEAGARGHGDGARLHDGEPRRRELAPYRPTGQLLHHQQAQPVVLDVVVDRHYVRVVERRQHLGLGEEPGLHVGVGREGRRQLLNRDSPAELLVAALEDHAPAPPTEFAGDLVIGQRLSDAIEVGGGDVSHELSARDRPPPRASRA